MSNILKLLLDSCYIYARQSVAEKTAVHIGLVTFLPGCR